MENYPRLDKTIHDSRYRVILTAMGTMVFNFGYALYLAVLGWIFHSFWFAALCAYYLFLSGIRFVAVIYVHRSQNDKAVIKKIVGGMLIALSVILAGSNYYSIVHEVVSGKGTIVMITIAAYTFCKVGIAIYKVIKERKFQSTFLTVVRNISFADAAASVLSLQRSMLTSFEGMNPMEIRLMNIVTGAVICLLIFVMGLSMLVKTNRKPRC